MSATLLYQLHDHEYKDKQIQVKIDEVIGNTIINVLTVIITEYAAEHVIPITRGSGYYILSNSPYPKWSVGHVERISGDDVGFGKAVFNVVYAYNSLFIVPQLPPAPIVTNPKSKLQRIWHTRLCAFRFMKMTIPDDLFDDNSTSTTKLSALTAEYYRLCSCKTDHHVWK